MDRRQVILGAVLVVVGGGLAVYAAQHAQIAVQPLHEMAAAFHDGCGSAQDPNATAKSHVPDHIAKALELTSTQLADLDRMSAELCQTMTKAHEAMMNVLTPEQRAKIGELHGNGHDAGGLHALLRKMHGG